MLPGLAIVNTVVYGPFDMTKQQQLSAEDWLDQGLRTLARSGFTALKAEPLAKTLKVSRGSFYWHFTDTDAFHIALLKRWRDVAVEQIIADVDQGAPHEDPVQRLLRRVFRERLGLEIAVRSWAAHDAAARKAVQAVDRRRLAYVEQLLAAAGVPAAIAGIRAQVLYWAFLGFALTETALVPERLAAVLDELIRLAHAPA
jgi:AcrR family transcriptional regulator